MTEVVNRSSADESEEKPRTMSLTETSPTSAIESEYDTASTNSRSDNERDEYEDSEDSLDEEVSDEENEGGDDERESGDGQEELESENGTKKKVDHDEDRSNPQYIPKRGTFYEHDDRTVEDLNAAETVEESEVKEKASTEGLSNVGKVLTTQNQKVVTKKTKEADRWSHDRFNEFEQAPKSRAELVSAYGYDIRSEDGPPRPRRQRRYGRHQSKYSRNWEDEEAYKKSQSLKPLVRRSLRAEDFPVLGSTPKTTRTKERSSHRARQDENDPKSYGSPERRRDPRASIEEREKPPRDQRNQRYNNDTSNNNNARHVKGKKNINFNHNIEFKNQNRKNINYETIQSKNNNVLNQQMQSGNAQGQTFTSQQTPPQTSNSGVPHHHQQQQHASNQRYNNNEAPLPTLSFTNSKMNNASNSNSSNAPPPNSSSRGMLNFDNSSGNYGRAGGGAGNRDKEVNSQSNPLTQAMSPNKNMQQQYSEHQMDQMKYMEKNYSQQGKPTNLNLNQHQSLNNVPQDPTVASNADMLRSKRYSSLRQRSNINDAANVSVQQQPPQAASSQHYHSQYHQQELEPTIVQIPPQQSQSYTSQTPPNILTAPAPQQQPQTQATQQQTPKYQAAYYTTSPEYALMQAAMVEKYQYQQQSTPAQYIPPQQQAQQIYMPAQSQPSQQQQILNYVSTIQPQGPSGAPAYPQYTNFQSFNIQPTAAPASAPQTQHQPPSVPPASQNNPQGIYQTQSGLTYFPNAQIAPAHQQRILQPQRRPNPIPILAPPDKNKMKAGGSSANEDCEKGDEKGNEAENIDHILDNMFVQRPMTNVISLKDPAQMSDQIDDQINENMNNMSLGEEKKGDGGK